MSCIKTISLAMIVFSLFTFSQTVAQAGPFSGKSGKSSKLAQNPEQVLKEMTARLNLTDEQKKEIKAIFEDTKKKVQAQKQDSQFRSDMMAARKARDMEKAQALAKDYKAKKQAASEALRKEVEAVLTPEQVKELEAMEAEMEKKKAEAKAKAQFKAAGAKGRLSRFAK